MTAVHILLVGLGGFFGAMARYFFSKKLNGIAPYRIPMGTLIVNLIGSFLLGIITGAQANAMIMLLLGTGFMGAFTTFSTFKLELIKLYLNKDNKNFLLYIIITYSAGMLLAYLGFVVGSFIG
ncbi:fluoride efflux transporter CrcB [Neobacillus thermocopriae]|uniref:Fluoride-specific ion channel FluC n=1 Tax=Neobacillus thermocopriae TaxID=1215031 RepID=A0A6B3TR73_9BACI|nr:fluoride efflux transporter CrcB [Neobacillus thermocopriae]MED3623804.1 fluoride efflux transporter CrcB [Neobacillus thermocopriae]MED3712987.1 fluoride efflux transporter CrcB [Neobacillus thermocopriae]NEX79078.1 fluoride efflux transporter CrcB [Neobacillus thermocopriae]